MKILVLDAHSNVALAVLQSLGKAGYDMYLAGKSESNFSWTSRYPRKRYIYPDPLESKDKFKLWIVELRKDEYFDYIIPITDSTIYPLIELRRESRLSGAVILPPDKYYEDIFNKVKTLELARKLGIDTPVSERISPNEWKDKKVSEFPVYIKPVRSKIWDNNGVGINLAPKLATNADELRRYGDMFAKYGDVIIQEYVKGSGIGVEVLCDHGDIIASFAHQRLHEYPLTGGGSTYRVSIDMPKNLYIQAQKILKAVEWSGVAMVEFKVDKAKSWLMEVNGRFWGSLPLAIAAGVDFPKLLIDMVQDCNPVKIQKFKTCIYSRKFSSDIQWFKENLKANRNHKYLLIRPVMKSIFEWFRVFTGKEFWDNASWHDPRPIITEIKTTIVDELRAIVRQLRIQRAIKEAKTHSLKVLRSKNPKHILILCHGNIYRSPFIEKYLNQKLDIGNFCIRSAGFYHKPNRKSSQWYMCLAAQEGVDLREHRSSVINRDLCRWADMIVIMDRDNWDELYRFDKKQINKSFLLGALGDNGCVEIKDPYASSRDEAKHIISHMKQMAEILVHKLQHNLN